MRYVTVSVVHNFTVPRSYRPPTLLSNWRSLTMHIKVTAVFACHYSSWIIITATIITAKIGQLSQANRAAACIGFGKT